MKKIISSIFLITILTLMVLPLASNAVELSAPNSCTMSREIKIAGGAANGTDLTCAKGATIDLDSSDAVCCVANTIYKFTDWFFVIIVGISAIWATIGALKIVTAGDKQENVDSGRKQITFAAIGLAVAFIARALPQVIITLIK